MAESVPWATVLPAPDGPAAAVPPVTLDRPAIDRPATVPPCSLAELAALIGARPAAGVEPLTGMVSGVTGSAAAVRPGDLFAALPGSRRHGIEFLPAALAAGAVAVLTDPAGARQLADGRLPVLVAEDPRAALGPVAARVYDHPSGKLPVL